MYEVYRVFKDNYNREILFQNLTRIEAQTLVQNAPDEQDSMVVFDKQ
tara:strand:+ start:422 stop:562 length:141 start_codon:yes stop_codon:yes gene_type:complete